MTQVRIFKASDIANRLLGADLEKNPEPEYVSKEDYDNLQTTGIAKAIAVLEENNPTVQAHISILNKIYDLKDYILGKPNKADEVFHIIEQFRELDKDKLHKYVEVREKAASAYRALQQLFQSNDVKAMVENLQEAVVRHQISNRDLKLKNQEYHNRIMELVKEKSDIEKKLQGYELAEWVRTDPKASMLFYQLQKMTEPEKQFIYKLCDNLVQLQKEREALMKGKNE